jgi:uncharacterized protein
MTVQEKIDQFLSQGPPFAVVGASSNRSKYGNKVLRCYIQNGLSVYPVNPKEREIEDIMCFPNLGSLPEQINSVSVITPPIVSGRIVGEATKAGVRNLWLQPGAESSEAVEAAEEAGLNVIAGGPCVLVVLGYRE